MLGVLTVQSSDAGDKVVLVIGYRVVVLFKRNLAISNALVDERLAVIVQRTIH